MIVLFDDRQKDNIINMEILSDMKLACEKSLEIEGVGKQFEISISLVNNDEIRMLNKEYRGIDKETDVLSFPLESFDFPGEMVPLGDIIISTEKALEQAEEYGHSLKREMVYLTVHSMFHLLGYDHMTQEDKKEMRSKEKKTIGLMEIYKNEMV